MPKDFGRGRKVCIVQYNASQFLARVDRSARALASAGFEVVLVAIKDQGTEAFENRGDYTVKRVELRSRAWPRWTRAARFVEAVARTFSAAMRENADVYNPRDIYPLLVCFVAAKLRGAAVVYDSDELNLYRNWPWTRTRWWKVLARAYEGAFIRRAALNITSDEGRADVLVSEYGIRRPVVVRNVPEILEHVEADAAFRAEALGDRRCLLLYTGGLVPNRGLLPLVAAMEELPECALAFVGFGHLRDAVVGEVSTRGLQERVKVYDAVPYDQLMRITASADALVIPIEGACLSYVYAAPNKLFEAMMAGVPVVASDLPDMAAVVRSERVGTLIADPADPHSIATAVRLLIDGDEPLTAVGARGREAALARYNWAIERERLLQAWESIVPALRPMRAS